MPNEISSGLGAVIDLILDHKWVQFTVKWGRGGGGQNKLLEFTFFQ